MTLHFTALLMSCRTVWEVQDTVKSKDRVESQMDCKVKIPLSFEPNGFEATLICAFYRKVV